MSNEANNEFWKILRADEIEDFVDLLDLATKILKRKVAKVDILAGGLTNKSFKITFEDGFVVVMRLAGKGTGEFISRKGEKRNSALVAALGIAPEVYYFDAETGSQLVEFIKLPTLHIEDFQNNATVLEKAAKLVSTLHNSGMQFLGEFDPVAGIDNYENILQNKNFTERYDGWDETYKTVLRIKEIYKKNPPKLAPCHCDILAENFMYDGKDMKLIDWEYGGMADPYYDASGIITENVLSEKATDIYLNALFGGKPTDEQYAKIMIGRFLYCSYWSIWSLVQIANGKDRETYWQYGLDRALLGKEYREDPNFESYLSLIEG